MDYIEQLKTRVRAYEGQYVDLADESGVSLSWLSKFVNGKIPNPTVGSLSKVDAAVKRRERRGRRRQ